VDGTTTGPLNVYALLPLNLLGLPLDYFSARLTGLLLAWAALLCTWRFFCTHHAPTARLAVLPGAVFFACVTDVDFIHYSSELVPLAVLAWATSLVVRRPLAAAFVAGWLPWTKLQAAPLAVALVGWQLAMVWRDTPAPGAARWRRAGALAGLAAAPSLLILAATAAFGQLVHLYRRYILQNIDYVNEGNAVNVLVGDLWRRTHHSGHFPVWCGASLLLLLGFGAAYLAVRLRPGRLYWLGAILTGTAVVCILVPERPSLHYFLFLVIPVLFWKGVALGELGRNTAVPRALVAGTLVCALAPLGWRLVQPVPDMVGQLSENWRQPRSPLGTVLRHWHRPGVRLTVWGWLSSAHAESGLPQGTRDTLSVWAVQATPQRDYYAATYLADMIRNRPELFVDAVGPGSPFLNNRATEAHEILPALADFIRQNYRLVVDLRLARVYARNDFLAAHPLDPLTLQQLVARGRPAYENPAPPDGVSPDSAPKSQVDGEEVQMLEPPAEMLWRLQGSERKVRIDFGVHPKAWTEGRTDGAGIVAELRMPGQPPLEVYHRLIDPRQLPADRGLLSAEIEFPPFPSDTALVVRTTAGPAQDTAWDWVYVKHVWFSHSPFYTPRQFPGFRRVPDRIDAAYPYLVEDASGRLLILPPPAALSFTLAGTERRLNFAFGLLAGAYTGSGRSDGAIYQVELQRAGEAPRVIFDRHLMPLAREEDRGRQSADVVLPADVSAGDRLVLRITGGENNSWDWTYVAALDLR
jgi:hypothetical protein